MNERLVSLVMAAWRPRRDWLLEAVASALGQRGCRIELIVVDDGSPEPVADLLADVEDERLRVIRVEHGGESRARNAGIAAASGERIRFIDADDALGPHSTARLLGLMGDDDDVVAYGATMVCDEELRPVWKLASSLHGDVRRECLLGRFTVRPVSLLFPRRVVERAGEWDSGFRVAQDWDFVLRALEHASVRGNREIATYYRKHGSSATASIDAGIEGGRRVAARYFDRHPEDRGTALERQAKARLAAMEARIYATHGYPRQALRPLLRSLAADPRAVPQEVLQSLPALGGRVARRIRRLRGGTRI